jgi:glucans biosynthesis protein
MWQLKRLSLWLALLILTAPAGAVFARLETVEVNFDYVLQKAMERAQKPFHSPRADLPAILRADSLDYDKYREIRFRHENALWAAEGLPFHVEFFHPGYLYEEPVHMYEFMLNHMQPIRFSQDFFDYSPIVQSIKDQIPANTGYAGFRLMYPLNNPQYFDELGAFLGASYFRLLGKGMRYGPSARGLAVDCGEGDRPEEFPIFTDWWLGKPQLDDRDVHLYAILDSVSCVGAYSFTIHPGDTTIADIDAAIIFREQDKVHAADPRKKPVATIGVAPLTSMFWFGKNSERKYDDYRPEVHDSDGLLMKLDNGEVLWRPLNNGAVMEHQHFAVKDVRGFGLLQRERNWSAYQDIFNDYHLVPSIWVEPHGNWGDGEINLVELNTWFEGMDNIVAFWCPKELPKPLQPVRFSYSLYWLCGTEAKLSPERVIATRIGVDHRFPDQREIVIDFSGPKLDNIPQDKPPLAIASCSDNATIPQATQVLPNPIDGGWRVILYLQPKPGNSNPVDLRCTLTDGKEPISETWTYLWSPP